MANYTEEDLANALQSIQTGDSYRQAADKWGIPLTTLYKRCKSRVSRQEAQQCKQRLSVTQEASLTNWILAQSELGLAPTHQQIRHFVQRILANGGDHQPLGKHWMEGFFARNPAVKTIKGKKINSARLKSVTAKSIQDLFDRLKIPALQDIPPHCRYNMDETGIIKG